MQYVLTEEEYKKLGQMKTIRLQKIVIDELRKALVEVKQYPCQKGYCDDCPIVEIYKIVSKRCPHEFQLQTFCDLNRDFSK